MDSTDSADQRAGRAGRVRAGNCLRLWTRSDQHRRLLFRMPEIGKRDLSHAVAQVQLWGSRFQIALAESTSTQTCPTCHGFRRHLGMLEENGSITEMGKATPQIPLPLPISKNALLAKERGKL